MFDNLRQDIARLCDVRGQGAFSVTVEGLLFDNGFQAVVLYRLAHWFKAHRWRFFGPFFGRLAMLLTGVEIAPATAIGPGLMISHGTGLVIGQWARLGSGVTLLHQVTIGGASIDRRHEMPVIGDRVFIGAGAKLIGPITVGDDAFIGVNCVISRNIPPGHRVLARGGISVLPRKDLADDGGVDDVDVDVDGA